MLSLNLGIFLSLTGLCFSVFNLITIFSRKDPLVKNDGDYGNVSRMLTKDDALGLGYAYPPNLKNYTSKKVAYHTNFRKEVIYEVTYNTDSLSNRYTPHDNSNIPSKSESILFLGDSLTFGEGLNDNETLSYFIQTQTGRSSLNAGLHGYGAHQSLKILEDEDLFKKRTKGHTIKSIIYRSIENHINRTAGYSPWDIDGPCYELTGPNIVQYKGSFADCGKKDKGSKAKILRSVSTSEPFTKQFAKRFTTYGKYSSRNYRPEDVDRFVTVVSKMNSIAKSKGINFFVVLKDVERHDELCGQEIPFAHQLEGKLRRQHINIILTSNVYTEEVCISNKLTISKYDGHPSMIANKLLSEYIINNYSL